MGRGDPGPLPPEVTHDGVVVEPEGRITHLQRPQNRLDQDCPEIPVALLRPAALPLSTALVVSRREPHP